MHTAWHGRKSEQRTLQACMACRTDGISRTSTRSDLSGTPRGNGAVPTEALAQRAPSHPAEVDALRQQVPALHPFQCAQEECGVHAQRGRRNLKLLAWVQREAAQALAERSNEARQAAEGRVQELEQQMQSMHERMAVLKEQLMSGQAAAEECEQQVVQDAVFRTEAKFGELLSVSQREVCHLVQGVQCLERCVIALAKSPCPRWLQDVVMAPFTKGEPLVGTICSGEVSATIRSHAMAGRLFVVGCLCCSIPSLSRRHTRAAVQNEASQRRIQQLEAQLQQHAHSAASSRAAATGLADAQQRVSSLEAELKAVGARCTSAEGHVEQLKAALDAKAGELQNLELAMGELTYEAESARGAELRSRQLQVLPLTLDQRLLCFCSWSLTAEPSNPVVRWHPFVAPGPVAIEHAGGPGTTGASNSGCRG